MRAVVCPEYGSPDVLELRELPTPVPADDEVLVRVRASSVNPADWHSMRGSPFMVRFMGGGIRRPKDIRLGTDFAGTVEAVGDGVADFSPGDDVYGARTGAFAEYVAVKNAIVPKPANVTFEEAAAVPVAAVTALQGVRKADVQAGQKVLVNGASGGVGTFAVQLAKVFGAEVTGVCSTRNVDLVRSLGADHVVDYTQDDFTRAEERYDVILDIAGGRSWSALARVLTEAGTVVMIGGPIKNRLVGVSAWHMVRSRIAAMFGKRRFMFFIAKLNRDDLGFLSEQLQSGSVRPVVERTYELSETADALRYLGTRHCRAKVVVTA